MTGSGGTNIADAARELPRLARRRAFFAAGLLAAIAVSASAQERLTFSSNPREAVNAARNSDRPLMFYVVGRDWEDIEDAHARAFRNPQVVAASRRFVPARLILSQHRDLVAQWGLGAYAHDVVFTTADGNMLDIAPSWMVARPDAFVEKMRAAFDRYREDVFFREIAPVLQQEEPKEPELRRALKRTGDLVILRAEGPIEKLLKREKLSDAVKLDAFDALASLSTPQAVKLLMKNVQETPSSAAALARCTPAAADEFILPYLTDDGFQVRMDALAALAKICDIRDARNEKFWKSDNERAHRREIERVRKLVRRAADRWRERHEYR